jgi:hypothetical protein
MTAVGGLDVRCPLSGKRRYATFQEAGRRPDTAQVYWHPACQAWHMSTQPYVPFNRDQARRARRRRRRG